MLLIMYFHGATFIPFIRQTDEVAKEVVNEKKM